MDERDFLLGHEHLCGDIAQIRDGGRMRSIWIGLYPRVIGEHAVMINLPVTRRDEPRFFLVAHFLKRISKLGILYRFEWSEYPVHQRTFFKTQCPIIAFRDLTWANEPTSGAIRPYAKDDGTMRPSYNLVVKQWFSGCDQHPCLRVIQQFLKRERGCSMSPCAPLFEDIPCYINGFCHGTHLIRYAFFVHIHVFSNQASRKRAFAVVLYMTASMSEQ